MKLVDSRYIWIGGKRRGSVARCAEDLFSFHGPEGKVEFGHAIQTGRRLYWHPNAPLVDDKVYDKFGQESKDENDQ